MVGPALRSEPTPTQPLRTKRSMSGVAPPTGTRAYQGKRPIRGPVSQSMDFAGARLSTAKRTRTVRCAMRPRVAGRIGACAPTARRPPYHSITHTTKQRKLILELEGFLVRTGEAKPWRGFDHH